MIFTFSFVIIEERIQELKVPMKLLYTDVNHSITDILVEEADRYAKEGYRLFYIAPNSLSFEKERSVLERLVEQASFSITVTRFGQMARYFTLDKVKSQETLDDAALSMLLYRALDGLSEENLKLYYHIRKDLSFIAQLMDLYKELKSANISIMDIAFEDPLKKADLVTIFTELEDILRDKNLTQESSLDHFSQAVASGQIEEQLKETVVVIDGFTRFSSEEALLISLLQEKCHQVVIGTYMSPKAYQKTFTEGNLYQASIDFFRQLSTQYQVKAEYRLSNEAYPLAFQNITNVIESLYDFSEVTESLEKADAEVIEIWQTLNQKEEIEHLAKDIRQKLYDGYRYKDILVLLGDVEAYQLQMGQIFEKFEIPYYFGRLEEMAHHPILQFFDGLERIQTYKWRKEDVLSVLKTGLFGHFSSLELDTFEGYLQFADINGPTKFSKVFKVNLKDNQGRQSYNLENINKVREAIYSPLNRFLSSKKDSGASLIESLLTFLHAIDFTANLQELSYSQNENQQEKDLEVWKNVTSILEKAYQIFNDQVMSLDEMLSLIKTGLQMGKYRAVPATLDVVTIKSYDLVEPHSKDFVYAIGMTQSHFPKIAQNKSLVSDQERSKTNESLSDFGAFEVSSHDITKKNHFSFLSLLNAANQKLVLSLPLVLNEVSENMSPYLKTLIDLGIPMIEKDKNRFSSLDTDIGNYKSLLSSIIEINNLDQEYDLSNDEENFWNVMSRYLRKRLVSEQFTIPQLESHRRESKPLSSEVIQARYPLNQPISLSNSALTVFYNNQYKYFLQYILGLQELASIHPDARLHGSYLHKVLEKVMKNPSKDHFDSKVNQAIQETNQENEFRDFYLADSQGQFSLNLLEEIARSTTDIFKSHGDISIIAQEKPFKLALEDRVIIKGVIDRIDQLNDQSLGIVDYKSSANVFDISLFYNGLNSQLPTYLSALKEGIIQPNDQEFPLFGAMYLHMQEPKIKMTEKADIASSVLETQFKEMKYQGIFLEKEKDKLASGPYHLQNNTYSDQELALILAFNKCLYLEAERIIRKGHFLINPYTKDGKTVQGDQLKAITGFEADLNFDQARPLLKIPGRQKKETVMSLMTDQLKGGE